MPKRAGTQLTNRYRGSFKVLFFNAFSSPHNILAMSRRTPFAPLFLGSPHAFPNALSDGKIDHLGLLPSANKHPGTADKNERRDSQISLKSTPGPRDMPTASAIDDAISVVSRPRTESGANRATFYESFKMTFPELVRENKKTAQKQQLPNVPSLSHEPTVIDQEGSYGNAIKHRKQLEREEEEIVSRLQELEIKIEEMQQERVMLQDRLDTVRDMQVDLSDTIDRHEEHLSFDEDAWEEQHQSNNFPIDSRNLHWSDTCVKTMSGHTMPLTCVDFVDIHDACLSGSEDGTLRFWDLGRFRSVRTLYGHDSAIRCLQYDGQFAVSAGDDRKIMMWSLGSLMSRSLLDLERCDETDLLVSTLHGHLGPIHCLQFDEKRSMLMTGSADNTVRIWDMNSGRCFSTLHSHAENDLIQTSSSASASRPVGLASIAAPGNSAPTKGVNALQFYSHALATGGHDGILRLWDTRVKSSRPHTTMKASGETSELKSMGDSTASIRTEDAESRCKRRLAGHTLPITTLQFDDRYLMSGSLDRSLRVWDLRKGQVVEGFMSNAPNGILKLQFDQQRIVAASGESDLLIVDRQSKAQHKLKGHLATVRALRFHDNKLISGGDDCVLKVWDI